MEALKMIEKAKNINWKYDPGADVLYISIGEPRNAEGIDIGDGIISRVDSANKEIVGLTILNFSARTLKLMGKNKGHG